MRQETFTLRSRVFEAAERDVDAGRLSVVAQQPQVVAGAAAAIEQPQIRSAAGSLVEQRRDEAAEATEPEVVALCARGRVEKWVHQACDEIDTMYIGR